MYSWRAYGIIGGGRGTGQPQMLIGEVRRLSPLPCSNDEPDLQQKGFDHVLQRVTFLAHRGGDRLDSRRTVSHG